MTTSEPEDRTTQHPVLIATRVEATDASAMRAARALMARAEEHDGLSPVSDQAMLAVAQGQRTLLIFAEPGTDGITDDGIDADGIVAAGIVGDGEVDLVVRPDARGRGIGGAALELLLAEAPGELLAWAHGENPAAEALLAHAGFAPVRLLFRMALDPARLPADGRDPLGLRPPEGFTLRVFRSGNAADVDAWVAVNAAAFATHPEQGRMTADDVRLVTEEPWFDPDDLFLLAGPSGALAGSTWVKTIAGEPGEAPECELYAVGVHPEYAGHGLGRFLLDVTLARMAEHRPNRVTLYVDGDNERAVELYRRAGFTVDSRSRQWRRSGTLAQGVRMDA